ncbi:arylsulfatase [Stieleria sp. TO1_6]|nr:arylsulfatase [Stieleria tagensis]
MVDDLGFSDIGCYGSEIETPHLDQLAGGGLRFSQFYNTAKCHSSRVCLLTGQYCIAAGDVALTHAVTSAEVLRGGGYFTAMSGKWHLKGQPTEFGFDRYFGHLSGACNYFKGDKSFRLNGQPWTVPDDGFYTTVADVNFGLQFLNQARQSGQPWHLYVAFNAPHAPLQALPSDYAKYEGRYDAGWDVMRQKRLSRQQQLGLLPKSTTASERPDHVPAWDSLTENRKRFERKRMTALAGMIDRVDQEIGRLVDDLQRNGELDNTLIWFVSDNGACPYDRRSNNLDSLPTDGTVSWSDSTGWAWARNSPFRYYKQNQFEGGACTPAIVHWPAGISVAAGSILRQPAHLIDVMPTLAAVTGSTVPTTFADRDLRPVSGISLQPLFNGEVLQREQPIHFLFAADRGLRDGDWKAVSFRSGPWELYNIANDRTERQNLAADHPERTAAMVDTWTTMADQVLHAAPGSYAAVDSDVGTHRHPEWTDFSKDPVDGVNGNGNVKKSKAAARGRANAIRARKNTRLIIQGDQLNLTFSGDDPGLAFDRLPTTLPPGPYQLSFELNSDAVGNGEMYFTTSLQASLPQGNRIPFAVKSNQQWNSYAVDLTTDKPLAKLRLDVSDGPGRATIRRLQLCDANGKPLIRWPDATTK